MAQKKAAARKKTKTRTKTKTKVKKKPGTRVKTKTKAKTGTRTRAKTTSKVAPKMKTKTKAKTKTKTKTKARVKAKAKTAPRTAPKAKAAPKGKPGKRLGKKVLDEMRAAIMAERQRIIRELGRIEETINDATQGQEGSNQSYSNHLADIGTDYMEQEKNFYYASQEGHYLRSLDEALERIERGEYGICEMCGDLIGEKRLKAVPSARLCIKCKSESEKTQRGR
jgi:DnaK suppressor protein